MLAVIQINIECCRKRLTNDCVIKRQYRTINAQRRHTTGAKAEVL